MAIACEVPSTGFVMKKLAVENALRCVLAAWTLLATTLGSSIFAHSHIEGDRPHQHDRSDCVSYASAHSCTSVAVEDSHEGDVCLSAADFHQHGCGLLPGAIKYLPTPSAPNIPHGTSPYGWETIIAVSAAQGTRACSNGVAAVGHWQLGSPVDLCVGCVCPTGQHETSVLGVAPSTPLCDRARHERSGVLLA